MVILLILAVLVVGVALGYLSFSWVIRTDVMNDTGFYVTYVERKNKWLIVGDPDLVMRKVDNWQGDKTVINKQTLLQKLKRKNE